MKQLQLVALTIALSVAGAAATTVLLTRDDVESTDHDTALAEIAQRLDALERRQGTTARVRAPEPRGQPHVTPAAGLTEADVPRIVDLRIAASTTAAEPANTPVDVTQFLAQLSTSGLSQAERDELWAQVQEAGATDELVSRFEAIAGDQSRDATAQLQLARAYFAKMRSTPGGPQAGKWGSRGADALLRALELDETNWEARFALARHYYWADMQAESLREFELLVRQQRDRTPLDKHAEAFVWLGHLYYNLDRAEDAEKTWRSGLDLFPKDTALQSRLELLDEVRDRKDATAR